MRALWTVSDLVSFVDATDHFVFCEVADVYPLLFAGSGKEYSFRQLPSEGRIDFAFMQSLYADAVERKFEWAYVAHHATYERESADRAKFASSVMKRCRSQRFIDLRWILSCAPSTEAGLAVAALDASSFN